MSTLSKFIGKSMVRPARRASRSFAGDDVQDLAERLADQAGVAAERSAQRSGGQRRGLEEWLVGVEEWRELFLGVGPSHRLAELDALLGGAPPELRADGVGDEPSRTGERWAARSSSVALGPVGL
jgi:hypothetical protein